MPHEIFISHVEEDAAIAIELAQALEQAGFTTWYYERDCLPGPQYLLQVTVAIDQAKVLVLIISAHSLSSSQVTSEVVRAYEAGKSFVPLLLGITHAEFQQRQPVWRQALGASTSLSLPTSGLAGVLPRVLAGVRALITPSVNEAKVGNVSPIFRPVAQSQCLSLAFRAGWHLREFPVVLPLPSSSKSEYDYCAAALKYIIQACHEFLTDRQVTTRLNEVLTDVHDHKLFLPQSQDKNRDKFCRLQELRLEVEGKLMETLVGEIAIWFQLGQSLGQIAASAVVDEAKMTQPQVADMVNRLDGLLERMKLPDFLNDNIHALVENVRIGRATNDQINEEARRISTLLLQHCATV